MRVLITTESTADDRKTLAAVRSLGRAGAYVTVAGDCIRKPPFLSRFCRQRVALPSAAIDMTAYASALEHYLATNPQDALLALTDHTVKAVARDKSKFNSLIASPIPTIEVLERAHDKFLTLDLAKRLGISVPETRVIKAAHLDEACREMQLPIVIKPRRGAGSLAVGIIRNERELASYLKARENDILADEVYDLEQFLVQEFVPGPVNDVCTLVDHGRTLVAVTQKRHLMHPASGGVGVYNETTDNPKLRDEAVFLLEAMKFHGPALVEFKHDPRDGQFKLMEVNGRFWGTLDLSIQAGVNFPLLACDMALGKVGEVPSNYTIGLRYRWPVPFGLSALLERRWSDAANLLVPQKNKRSDLWFSDPVATAGAIWQALRILN